VPIYVAALRGMLRVAGEVGDGVILNCSAADVPAWWRGARGGGRGRDPASIEITARLLVNVDPGSQADAGVRHVTAYLNDAGLPRVPGMAGARTGADADVAGVGG
jgi:hypothetical protein